jgi:gluconolactonase
MDFIRSLNLEEKLSPRRNADIIWFYIFFPCVVAYFVILTGFINSKPTIGTIEAYDPAFSALIYPGKEMEIIATGLGWSEGPLWVQDDAASLSYLMFSDTMDNRIYKWEDGKGMFTVGKTIYVERSGCRANSTYCDGLLEPGSNALARRDTSTLDLLVCQHGERAVSLLRENGTRSAIATHYNGSKLNSPNDLVLSPEGHLYFTDPKYGLHDKTRTPQGAQLAHNGLYMIRAEYVQLAMLTGEPTDQVWLMDGTLPSPNGLAFSPDFSKLYVSNSERTRPIWKVYDVTDAGILKNGRVFYDASELYKAECGENSAGSGTTCESYGNPDGLKVDIYGNLFVTGPGGVLVISPEGKLIGRFRLDRPASNLAFGADGRLYITAGDIVVRVWVKTKPNRVVVTKA